MGERFDYVIVGAGTAGCVLANRLSADPAVTVALIEAGPPDSDPAIRVPALVARAIANPRNGWGYMSAPQRHADDRELPVPRGRVLGGCSSINGMVYFRGHPREYDEWNLPGWRHADLLPYFIRMENYAASTGAHRGHGGPVDVIDIPEPNPLVGRFLAATDSLGLPRCDDFAGAAPEGFGPRQATHPQRPPRLGRHRLPRAGRGGAPTCKIITAALVTRVVVDEWTRHRDRG